MKLPRSSTYALVATIRLAAPEHKNRPVASHLLAGKDIPERFLLKVLKPMVAARILISLKGPHGGYRLARPASEISLLDIIEAVDGPLRGEVPDFQSSDGPTVKALKRLGTALKDVTNEESKCLAKTTVGELAKK